MSWLAWLIIGILLVVVEIVTPTAFFALCLSLGAFAAAVAAYFHGSDWIEAGAFVVAAVISIYAIRPLLKKWMSKMDSAKSNVDELIGETAVVTQDISPETAGFVKVCGQTWLAVSDEELKSGQKAIIKSLSGTKVFVSKKQE
ncbi:MAG: NfeD family protein [Endomicrobium sp.]|jgi:membrane protein implicated in regulation of membrane protease activity|nr:NfeD family protein [Endomicrobium sp.]